MEKSKKHLRSRIGWHKYTNIGWNEGFKNNYKATKVSELEGTVRYKCLLCGKEKTVIW